MTRNNPRMGPPAKGDTSGQMSTITIRLDEETEQALEELCASAPPGFIRTKSAMIRQAILEKHNRLKNLK